MSCSFNLMSSKKVVADSDIAAVSAFGSLLHLKDAYKFNGNSKIEQEVKSFLRPYIYDSFRNSNEVNRAWMKSGLEIIAQGRNDRVARLIAAFHIDINLPDNPTCLINWAIEIVEDGYRDDFVIQE